MSDERLRILSAATLSIFGLLLAGILVIFLVSNQNPIVKATEDVIAIIGLFTSILGTLVGAFFGLQVGSSNTNAERERADRERTKTEQAEAQVGRLLASMPPDQAAAFFDGNR